MKKFKNKQVSYNSLPVLLRGQMSTLNPKYEFIRYTTTNVR